VVGKPVKFVILKMSQMAVGKAEKSLILLKMTQMAGEKRKNRLYY
jgi:hypothetical protein